MKSTTELVDFFNALPKSVGTLEDHSRVLSTDFLAKINQKIWNGSRHLGTTVLELIDAIKYVDISVVPFVLGTLIDLTGEPKYEHPKVSELLRSIGVESNKYLDSIIQSVCEDESIFQEAFSNATLPEFMSSETDIGVQVLDSLMNRSSEVGGLIRQLLSEAYISIDGVANDSKFIDVKLASSFIEQLSGKDGIGVLKTLAVLGGYSLLVGSQTMMDLKLVNTLGSAKNKIIWPEIVHCSEWNDIVKKVYVVTSGRGRSENWVFHGELMAMAEGKKSVNVGHLGGGAVEPLDIYRRLKLIGMKSIGMTNYDAHSIHTFDNMAAYSRYEGNPVEKYERGLDSEILEQYPRLVDHRFFDLRSPESIVEVYHNEVEKYDLLLSIHTIIPHLLPEQRLRRISDMFTMTKRREGIMVVGGWGTSNPVGCNRVVLQRHGNVSEIIAISMGKGTPKSDRTAISIVPVPKRDFEVLLPQWQTPIKSVDFMK